MTTVTIVYKSGAKVQIRCQSFKVTAGLGGAIRSVTWDGAVPDPLVIGIDQIAAIYERKA